MNGDSGLYNVSYGDLHGPRLDEEVIERFLRDKGILSNGTGIDKLCRLLAYLIQSEQIK